MMLPKLWVSRCPCGAESGWLPLDDAMRWGATHRCDEVQPS